GRLAQVLFERRAPPPEVGAAVERDQPFGQIAVVEPWLLEQRFEDLAPTPLGAELVEIETAGRERRAEVLDEREAVDLGEEARDVGRRIGGGIAARKIGREGLEHPARGA